MNWLKLDDLPPRDTAFLDYVRDLIALRQSRPLLRQSTFLRDGGPVEARWLRPDGETDAGRRLAQTPRPAASPCCSPTRRAGS